MLFFTSSPSPPSLTLPITFILSFHCLSLLRCRLQKLIIWKSNLHLIPHNRTVVYVTPHPVKKAEKIYAVPWLNPLCLSLKLHTNSGISSKIFVTGLTVFLTRKSRGSPSGSLSLYIRYKWRKINNGITDNDSYTNTENNKFSLKIFRKKKLNPAHSKVKELCKILVLRRKFIPCTSIYVVA